MFGKFFFLRLLCPCSRTLAWRLALLPFFTAARPHFGLFFVIFKEGSASSVTLPIVFFFFTLKDGSHCCFLSHVDVHKTCACRQMLS